MDSLARDLASIVEIVWINLILSGDNALVIAMACRGLPAGSRRWGMVLGAGVAVVLRVVFTVIVVALLATPFLKIVGGLLLFWIAVKLAIGEDEDEGAVPETARLWSAVRTVAIADAVMSLDNVLAIAAVAQDSTFLLVLGLAISVPLIVAGASLIVTLLDRFPVLLWAGAALLGWLAGAMIATDPWILGRFGTAAEEAEFPAAVAGAVVVLLCGSLLRARARRRGDLA